MIIVSRVKLHLLNDPRIHDNTNIGKVTQDGLMMSFSVLCVKYYIKNNLNSVSTKLEFRPVIRLPITNDWQLRNQRRSNQNIWFWKVMRLDFC